jgi:hypothetical protein
MSETVRPVHIEIRPGVDGRALLHVGGAVDHQFAHELRHAGLARTTLAVARRLVVTEAIPVARRDTQMLLRASRRRPWFADEGTESQRVADCSAAGVVVGIDVAVGQGAEPVGPAV